MNQDFPLETPIPPPAPPLKGGARTAARHPPLQGAGGGAHPRMPRSAISCHPPLQGEGWGGDGVKPSDLKLALFDLDNTLLNGDSDFEWSQFLIRIGILDRELFEVKNQAFYDQYKAGTLDIHEFLDFQLKPLSRHPHTTLDEWHGQFMREAILPMIGQPARDLVRQHQASGDLCVVITATNSFITAPIAREFGIEHLIATEPEQRGGEFTGAVAGIPSFKEGKIIRLENWLSDRGWTLEGFNESTFYSDSMNDLPLLRKVSHPVAANPDDTLRRHAEQHGWPIIALH